MSKTIRPKEIIKQRNRRLMVVALLLLLVCLAYLLHWWHFNRNWVTTDDAFVKGHIISVDSQTEGTIVEILAEDTQFVEKGQLLIRLDGVKAELNLQHTKAELAEAVRHFVALKAQVETLKQRIIARKAVLNQVRHDLTRFQGAAEHGAASAQEVQNAQDKMLVLSADIAAITFEKKGIEAELLSGSIEAQPTVEKAKSRLRNAYLELHRQKVVAPVAGIVAKRRAQVGDQVNKGTTLLVLVPITDLWVEANVLETQLPGIKPGKIAEIKIDAIGDGLIYHGVVEGINPATGSTFALFPTDHSTGNFIHIAERVPIRIGLNKDELLQHPLMPGLSTLTRINIEADGNDVFSSAVTTDDDAYRTNVFDHELEETEDLIRTIIDNNQVGLN